MKNLKVASEKKGNNIETEILSRIVRRALIKGKIKRFYSKQFKAINSFFKSYLSKPKKKYGMVVAATAFGKTTVAAEIIRRHFLKNKRKVLILTHRKTIMYGTWEELFRVAKIRASLIFNGTYFKFNEHITIATVQTIHKYKHIYNPDYFDLIVADECHHSPCSMWNDILSYFTCYKLGLTATPMRHDKKNVVLFYNKNILIDVPTSEATKKGWITPYDYILCKDNLEIYINEKNAIYHKGRKYTNKDKNRTLFIKERDKEIIKKIKKYFKKGDTAIAFAGGTKYAKYITEVFNKNKLPARLIDGETPDKTRDEILEALENNKIKIIVSINVINEGYNVPAVKGIIFLTPFTSFNTFIQRIGRALRIMEGKKRAIVLDFACANRAVSLILRYIERDNTTKIIDKISNRKEVYEYSLGNNNKLIIDEEFLPGIQYAIESRMSITKIIDQISEEEAQKAYDELKIMQKTTNKNLNQYPMLKQLFEGVHKIAV